MIEKRNSIYHRDHIEAFNNAKSKGLKNPEDYKETMNNIGG